MGIETIRRADVANANVADTNTPDADVVIVGAGASGCLMAAILAESGKRVVLLEAGPDRGTGDLISSQLWARRLKWAGSAVIESGAHPIGHGFNAGWGVGGGALHHYGVWPRFHEEDFALASRFGKGSDWPISYGDLRPFYDRVQTEVGLSGDAKQEIWRPAGAPYPMGPLPVFAQGQLLAKGFAALNKHTAPIPMAVNSTAYNGRAACLYDGWCDAGCPIGALANPLVTYLPRALRAGAQLRARATVRKILTDANDRRAIGVEYVDAQGVAHTQRADVVVLAAFTIQNPRLLLASATARSPNGLANRSGRIGLGIMTHPAVTVYGLLAEETYAYQGVTGGQLICQDGYAKTTFAGAFGSHQWLIGHALKPNDLLGVANSRPDKRGAALAQFLKRDMRRIASMTAVMEDLPRPDNRLTLGIARDDFGIPVARVTHSNDAQTAALFRQVREEGLAILKAAGATEAWTGPQAPMHIMGGTMMGADPAQSVTNSYGQCHDLPNLFVAGASVFPTTAAVNPTFTIHALALRGAEHMLKNWSGLTR